MFRQYLERRAEASRIKRARDREMMIEYERRRHRLSRKSEHDFPRQGKMRAKGAGDHHSVPLLSDAVITGHLY